MKNTTVGLFVLLAGCITHSTSAFPLYPNPENERPADEIGVLSGPVAQIDGRDVSDHGQAFALLPGCHSFKLLEKVGQVGMAGAYNMSLPQQTFLLQVRAGYHYSIDTKIGFSTGEQGTGALGVAAYRPDGTVAPAEGCTGP